MNPARPHRLRRHPLPRSRRPSFRFKPPLFFILFLILLLASLGIYVHQSRISFWQGQGRLTLAVVQSSRVGIFTFDPARGESLWLPLPNHTQVTLPVYGTYPATSLWQLGEQEKTDGGHLLTQALQWELGVGVDAYLSSPPTALFESSQPANIINQVRTTLAFLTLPKQTNLSLLDQTRFIWQITSLRSDKRKTLNLETAGLGQRHISPDDQDVFTVDSELLHVRHSAAFVNSRFSSPPLPITIINHTQVAGLAAHVAQVITSAGGQIAKVETSPSQPQETGCLLRLPPDTESYFVAKIIQWFNCRQEVFPQKSNPELAFFSSPV